MPQHIVITGSTQGIGYGLAEELVRRGHAVCVSGRNAGSVEQAVSRLRALGAGHAIGHPTDVTRHESVEALWDAACEELGRVDIWINNAGVARTTFEVKDLPASHIETMVQTNMLGTMYGSRVAVRGFLRQGGGKLFNMLGGGSDGAMRPRMAVYGATKRGLCYFTKALTKECEGTGVLVGQIRPGVLITEGMLREAREDPAYFRRNRRAMNILCDPVEEVMPFLVEGVLNAQRNGVEIAWLTGTRIGLRFMFAGLRKQRDLFAQYGL